MLARSRVDSDGKFWTGPDSWGILEKSVTGQDDNNELQDAGGTTAGPPGAFRPVTDAHRAPASIGESMHRGWVKLWRKWRDHEMASDPNATLVFLHLLTEARREPKTNRRYGYVVQRGQCDLTLGQLAEKTKLSIKEIRAAMTRLIRYETITRIDQKGKQPALTTIVNFDTYNPDTTPEGNQPGKSGAQEGQETGTKRATPGEVEKGEKEENNNPSSTKLTDEGGKEKDYPPGFTAFWQFYPRKVGKGAAFNVWKRMTRADKEEAIEQAEAYGQAYELAPESRRQFFKHPATWLNARGWEDDHAEWTLLIEGK